MINKKRSCGEKIQYQKLSTANYIVKKMTIEGEKGLSAYYCRYCDHYHVGHKINISERANFLRSVSGTRKKKLDIDKKLCDNKTVEYLTKEK